jgi:hypothetical protein
VIRRRRAIIGGLVLSSLVRSELAAAAPTPDEAAPSEPTFSPHPQQAVTPPPPEESLLPKQAGGFLAINGSAQSVPSAIARNQADYSLSGAVGVSATGHPSQRWDYQVFVVASAAADAVNGLSGNIAPEQIWIKYEPLPAFSILAGYTRIPFSAAQGTAISSSMFPTRPQPTDLFQGGADAGVLASYEPLEGRVKVKAGLFDGLSLRLALPGHTTNGPAVSGWAEISPLGVMRSIESDFGSPFHFAVGGGIIYRHATAYDEAGYQGLSVDDIRFSATVRMAYRGLFVQGEYLQGLRTDDLSGRPTLARGTYGEASYYSPIVPTIGIAPLTRLGWSVRDAGFFPLQVISADAGLAFYPRGDLSKPGSVRLIIEYQSERRLAEGQTAYGGIASVLALF